MTAPAKPIKPKHLLLAGIDRQLRRLNARFDKVQKLRACNAVQTAEIARLLQEVDAYRRREYMWKHYINRYRAALGMAPMFNLPALGEEPPK